MGELNIRFKLQLSTFNFYVQLFKTLFFPLFLTFSIFLKYKYTLIHFHQKVFSKKLDKLYLNLLKLIRILNLNALQI